MSPLQAAVFYLLLAFLVLLILRLVMEYVFIFARSWRPAGAAAALLEITYSVTDPPYKALRRLIPPLRLGHGGFGLDLAFIVLIVFVYVLMYRVVPQLP